MALGLMLANSLVSGGGVRPLDPAAVTYAARATSMDTVHIRRLSDWFQMLRGESGYWEQLSEDVLTSKVKGAYVLEGDYQLKPALKTDNIVSIFDAKGVNDLTATGISWANRTMRFTGSNYAQAAGKIITAAPWAGVFIGNINNAIGAQMFVMGQSSGSIDGRTTLFSFNANDGQALAFYNDGTVPPQGSELAGTAAAEASNRTRGFATRQRGDDGVSSLAVLVDGEATPKGNTADGRAYTLQNVAFTIGRTAGAALPLTGNGDVALALEGLVSDADLGRIVRNSDLIFRLGALSATELRQLPNGIQPVQFALQAATANTTTHYLGSPSGIVAGSEIIAFHDTFGSGTAKNTAKCIVSTDGGLTFPTVRSTIANCQWMTPFRLPGDPDATFYLIGTTGENLLPCVKKTTDAGVNWTSTNILGIGAFITGNVPVLIKDGFLYKVFEEVTSGSFANAVSVFKIDITSDLMTAGNWTRSNVVADTTYDPIFGTNTAGGQQCIEHNVVEYPDGSIGVIGRIAQTAWYSSVWSYDPAGSGTLTPLFANDSNETPFGWCKFHILRCPTTDTYLCFGNEKPSDVTDDRTLMKVWKSDDLVTWTVAYIVVDLGAFNYQEEGDSYPFPLIHGDDILLFSRLAFGGANSPHNSNRGAFRRIENYVTEFDL